MRMEMDIIVARGGFQVACQASFGPGVHMISGQVGSGKTTLALAMASLIPYQGRLDKEGMGDVLMSFQFPEHHITASRLDDEVRSWGLDPEQVLPGIGLDDRRGSDPLHLSRGGLKRLNLACVLARDPDLLILDEPFSSLDCVAKSQLCRAIEDRKGKITLLFSHERSVLPRVDTLSHVEYGRLIHHGTVPGSIAAWQGAPPYIRQALQSGARPENITHKDVREAICRMRD
ncbi:MAG: energy-coupling factor ABC transporter ATP-binding protein [Candidatus Methanomethylophilaceae archaeon]